MQSGTLQSSDSTNKQWPDFYSILDSSPETDGETLRRAINTRYIKANEQSDHRELNIRFYNQVLAQKVLPQCRLILLNEQMRKAYNQQWYLHRSGSDTALSYQEFIREISNDANNARNLLLSNDEISILPSLGVEPSPPALSALKSTTAAPPAPSPVVPAPTVQKKAFPVGAAVAGVLVLGIGGFVWNASRQSAPDAIPAAATTVAPAVVSAATTVPTDPPKLTLNTLAINADFEDGLEKEMKPWVTTNGGGFSGQTINHDAHSGKRFLTFWGAKSCDATVTQTIKGLKPGKYIFSAWTRRGGGQTKAEMFAEGFGGPRKSVVIPFGWSFINTTIHEIDVKSNQCTIGFSVKSLGNKTTNIDAVEFYRK